MFFNILRAGAAEAHVDFNFANVVGWRDLQGDFVEGRVNAAKNDRHQKKIGGDVIFGEPADHVDRL